MRDVSDAMLKNIRAMLVRGKSLTDIGVVYNCSTQTIDLILWANIARHPL